MQKTQVLIIGAGPAGVAAAIQLKRCGVEFVLCEKDRVGGLLHEANLVENYPGFPEGISGPELVRRLQMHLNTLEIEALPTEILQLDHDGRHFQVETSTQTVTANYLVIASGTAANPASDIRIAAEARSLVYHQVSSARELRNKQIAVVGAGDAAYDYSLTLARHNQVLLLQRSPEVKALDLLQKRVVANDSIERRSLTSVEQVDAVESRLLLHLQEDGLPKQLIVDALLLAFGRAPQLNFLGSELKSKIEGLEEQGKVHFAGDVRRGRYRQAAIAAGDGLLAAMKIVEQLREKQHEDNLLRRS
jgi:thioredoxin reductase